MTGHQNKVLGSDGRLPISLIYRVAVTNAGILGKQLPKQNYFVLLKLWLIQELEQILHNISSLTILFPSFYQEICDWYATSRITFPIVKKGFANIVFGK